MNGKAKAGTEHMFTTWQSIYEVDKMDFQTADERTIDVKTASRSFQTRILIPYDQFENQPKDYYVGIRIAEDERSAEIIGHATRAEMAESGRVNRGGYPAYERELRGLRNINPLLDLIANENPSR